MLHELVIGPQTDNKALLPNAKKAWDALPGKFSLPLDLPAIVRIDTVGQRCDGTAESQVKGSLGLITLGSEFFELSPAEQDFVLLHELLHIKFMIQLSNRQAWIDGRRRWANRQRDDLTRDQAQRQFLALQLWHMPEEALVERAFAALYPDAAADRARMFVKHWAAKQPDQIADQVIGPLKVYAALWEWTRGELVISLTETEQTGVALDLRDRLATLGADFDPIWPILTERAHRLLHVKTEPLTIDDDVADRLRDDVFAVELP